MDYRDMIALPRRFVNRIHGVSPGDAFLKRVDGIIHVGAAGILPSFRFVKVEVPDFESYRDAACSAN